MTKGTSSAVRKDQTKPRDRRLTPGDIAAFQQAVLSHYREHGRDLPWRRTRDPYRILVSEVMLQQTQVGRVIDKFDVFIGRFPDFATLAAAPLIEVLSHWKGLGYNRRALYLKEIARVIMEQHSGRLPDSAGELVKLPGIGKNTAGAIVAFAFNYPSVFIETNIRSVFIHHFFGDTTLITDARIIPLVEQTLFREDPRTWYWALMDYGSMLKGRAENPGRKSAHHTRQSPFKGSDREIRGAILGLFVGAGPAGLTESAIISALDMAPDRVRANLARLIEEGFVVRQRGRCRIA
jgi:A/G-specific adenine glycosylase